MNRDDRTPNEWTALRALGREASPDASDSSPHVAEANLARMRAGEPSAELETAYRHVASCAACRAKLLEAGAVVAQVSSEAQGTARSSDARGSRPRAPPSKTVVGLLVAAIGITVIAAGAAFRARDPALLGVAERELVAGHTPSSDVPPEERDIELSFPASPAASSEEAAVYVVDGAGRPLAPIEWFGRTANGQETVVLSQRLFAPHRGKAYGFVLAGEDGSVRRLVDAFGRALAPPTLDTYEASLRALVREAGRAVRMQKIPVGR